MSFRKFLIAAAIAGGATLAAPFTVGASADTDTVKAQLDELCLARGGTPIWTPYSIARCQDARANKGFADEQVICENAAGVLNVSISARHMNRAVWSCVATYPVS